jgi:hypothetical protein
MINPDDFKKADGYIDWDACNKARVEAGEKCYKCGGFIVSFSNKNKSRQLCSQCESLEEKDEVDHDSLIRCPKCKASWDISEHEDYHLYEDGEHDVTCYDCNHEFKVTTNVSYSFTSPELLDQTDKTEGEEDEKDS